jgi:dTDP-4-amino-4,6-dideoxygalactose transaminase
MNENQRKKLLARGKPDARWDGEPMLSGWYTEAEVDAITNAVRTSMDWTVGFGFWCEEILEFERNFAAYCGTEYAISITSCGAGLDMAMKALDLAPDDEVISPAINFCAGHYSVIGYGGKVIYCEVDPTTFCADPADVERLITPNTRAPFS